MNDDNLLDDRLEGQGFTISDFSKGELNQARKWAMFLAIFGFVMVGFSVIGGVFTGIFWVAQMGGQGMLMGLLTVALALVGLFPCLYLLRFSTSIARALRNEESFEVDTAFNNIKKYFKFSGILIIVIFGLYVLAIIGGALTALVAGLSSF